MDCRAVVLCWLAVLLVLCSSLAEGRNKKVVIHVPYKVKKIKHTHTIYKTIHHHHTHHEHEGLHVSPSEEHEHFHHVHVHEHEEGGGGSGQHSAPVPHLSIPEFLPDVPLPMPLHLNLADVPREPPISQLSPLAPQRHLLPLFRRA